MTTDLVSVFSSVVSRMRKAGMFDEEEMLAAALDEVTRLTAIEQAARVFYKRVSFRAPGLLFQIRDVDRPMREALRLDDDAARSESPCGDKK
jgi:hypothetical protein